MNANSWLSFWRTKTGVFILIAVGAMIAYFLIGDAFDKSQSEKKAKAAALAAKDKGEKKNSPLVEVPRNTKSIPPTKTNLVEETPKKTTQTVQSTNGKILLEKVKIFSSKPFVSTNDPLANVIKNIRPYSENFAPFGRAIPCELVTTLDSRYPQAPVIGVITKDIWWDKRLILRANSEVHGTTEGAITTSNGGVRGRISSGNEWVIILPQTDLYPNGAELTIKGVALEREDLEGTGESWGITDMAFGFKGRTIRDNDWNEIKLFASAFISAAADGLKDTETFLGFDGTGHSVTRGNSFQNAGLNGVQAVLNEYAEQIRQEIELNGFYTIVPAGTQFYLYIQQTVDMNDARIGDSQIAQKLQQPERDSDQLESEQFFPRSRTFSPISVPVSPAQQLYYRNQGRLLQQQQNLGNAFSASPSLRN